MHVDPNSYLARFHKVPAFATPLHERACESVIDCLANDRRIAALLLTCSCASGQASSQSCVDMTVLVRPEHHAQFAAKAWPLIEQFIAEDAACQALQANVPFDGIDIDLSSGQFSPDPHGNTTGPDWYEVEIGNTLAWVHPLLRHGAYLAELQTRYLAYYDDKLAQRRLETVLAFAHNNLDHVMPTARRSLYIQAHKRLMNTMSEFLQALFISRRIYPIAYDKWIREQLVDILQEPAMYDLVIDALAIPILDEFEFSRPADALRQALESLPSAVNTPSS